MGRSPIYQAHSNRVRRGDALRTAFAGLAKFRNLEQLRFDFFDFDYNENMVLGISGEPTHYPALQLDIFAALAANPPPSVVSLTMNNVFAAPNAMYGQEAFHSVFHRLNTLHISILSGTDLYGFLCNLEPFVDFWQTSLPNMVRSAVALTSLTIMSNNRPIVSHLTDTRLLHLSSLRLELFVLEPTQPYSGMLSFILAHRATLAHLELCGCFIGGGEEAKFSRPWYAVLAMFESKLDRLRTLVLSADRGSRFGYARSWGYEHMPVHGLLDAKERELAALESLMVVVESRCKQEEDD
ncbi:hypothetical protein B0H17DRAFT_1212299 [Mycena rosella]|uniref:Uncharacterized protein n=1 Tax=Mycena rosella TaxID=1033263 RepID=A0AAD7CST6_MYCRO|nr:hypothetical protein B0H17DRAFT_1212299 [Mycena rosella]